MEYRRQNIDGAITCFNYVFGPMGPRGKSPYPPMARCGRIRAIRSYAYGTALDHKIIFLIVFCLFFIIHLVIHLIIYLITFCDVITLGFICKFY